MDLWTKAEVKLTEEPHVFHAEITSDPKESTLLMEKTVTRVLQQFNLDRPFRRKNQNMVKHPHCQRTKKQQRRRKRNSPRNNSRLGKTLDDLEIVKLGVEAAFDAKVTVTGAFDDACASYFGGAVITDNLKREIVKQLPLTEDFVVLFHVPPQKAYTANSNVSSLKTVKPLVEVAYNEALDGKVWEALNS